MFLMFCYRIIHLGWCDIPRTRSGAVVMGLLTDSDSFHGAHEKIPHIDTNSNDIELNNLL